MSQTVAQSRNTTDTNKINDVILLVDFFFQKLISKRVDGIYLK